MTTVYIAPGVVPVIKWHADPGCHVLDEGKPIEKSELPEDATACTFCAGGVSAQELRERGEKA
jgi:hypothetical protein